MNNRGKEGSKITFQGDVNVADASLPVVSMCLCCAGWSARAKAAELKPKAKLN